MFRRGSPKWPLTSGGVDQGTSRGQEDQKDNEQNLRDLGGAGGEAAEPEEGGDQRDDQKDDGVVQHEGLHLLALHVQRQAILETMRAHPQRRTSPSDVGCRLLRA